MALFRNPKKDSYTTIDNKVFKDNNLSLKAKGMLCTLLSLPETWSFSEIGLSKLSNDGRAVIRNALLELISRGYLVRTQSKAEDGKFGDMIYTVYDEPTVVRFSDSGKTDSGKTTQYNTKEYYNTNINNNTKNINNTKVNNKIINNLKIKENTISKDIVKRKEKIVPPSLEEIQQYINEKNYNVDPKLFYDYFTESNWIDSNGKPVKNWKLKIITWNSHNHLSNKNNKTDKVIYEPYREEWKNI